MKTSITFTCMTAISRVCFAGKSRHLEEEEGGEEESAGNDAKESLALGKRRRRKMTDEKSRFGCLFVPQ